MPRIREYDALVGVQCHALGPGLGDVGSEVGDEEAVAQNRLDHLDGSRMGDEIPEDLVHGHEVENADVAGVGIEEFEMRLLALGFDRGLGFPKTIESMSCFFTGEHGWNAHPSVLF